MALSDTIIDILRGAAPVKTGGGGTEFVLDGFRPKDADFVSLAYTGSDLTTVIYKKGGSGGETIITLTLAYSGGNLVSVTAT